jgi:hypothetical protein
VSTPGPWFTKRDNFVHLGLVQTLRIVWAGTGDVAYVLPLTDGDNGNADASLISAAPDLLASGKELLALIDAVAIDQNLGDETDRVFPRYEFAALRAAIEKAEAKS